MFDYILLLVITVKNMYREMVIKEKMKIVIMVFTLIKTIIRIKIISVKNSNHVAGCARNRKRPVN